MVSKAAGHSAIFLPKAVLAKRIGTPYGRGLLKLGHLTCNYRITSSPGKFELRYQRAYIAVVEEISLIFTYISVAFEYF